MENPAIDCASHIRPIDEAFVVLATELAKEYPEMSLIDVFWETQATINSQLLLGVDRTIVDFNAEVFECECNVHAGPPGCSYRPILPEEWLAYDGSHVVTTCRRVNGKYEDCRVFIAP